MSKWAYDPAAYPSEKGSHLRQFFRGTTRAVNEIMDFGYYVAAPGVVDLINAFGIVAKFGFLAVNSVLKASIATIRAGQLLAHGEGPRKYEDVTDKVNVSDGGKTSQSAQRQTTRLQEGEQIGDKYRGMLMSPDAAVAPLGLIGSKLSRWMAEEAKNPQDRRSRLARNDVLTAAFDTDARDLLFMGASLHELNDKTAVAIMGLLANHRRSNPDKLVRTVVSTEGRYDKRLVFGNPADAIAVATIRELIRTDPGAGTKFNVRDMTYDRATAADSPLSEDSRQLLEEAQKSVAAVLGKRGATMTDLLNQAAQKAPDFEPAAQGPTFARRFQ